VQLSNAVGVSVSALEVGDRPLDIRAESAAKAGGSFGLDLGNSGKPELGGQSRGPLDRPRNSTSPSDRSQRLSCKLGRPIPELVSAG
jgi:hypothetical protein